MGIKRLAFAAATAIALLCGPADAGTITWNWSYTGIGVDASGTAITDDVINSLGGYTIQSFTGQRNAVAIDELLGTPGVREPAAFGYFEVDGTIFSDGSLDFYGIGYAINYVGGPVYYTIYQAPGSYFEFIAGGDIDGIRSVWNAYQQHPDGGAVPEIWTVALLAGGLGAMAFALRTQGGRMGPISI